MAPKTALRDADEPAESTNNGKGGGAASTAKKEEQDPTNTTAYREFKSAFHEFVREMDKRDPRLTDRVAREKGYNRMPQEGFFWKVWSLLAGHDIDHLRTPGVTTKAKGILSLIGTGTIGYTAWQLVFGGSEEAPETPETVEEDPAE